MTVERNCDLPQLMLGVVRRGSTSLTSALRRGLVAAAAGQLLASCLGAQIVTGARAKSDTVLAIARPKSPIPPEEASAGVTRFSFIAYGDTRGQRDGEELQHEHSVVIESMLHAISELSEGPDAVRFVVQTGDAVVDGRNARQWNRSFTALIDRLTTEGGIPYFLAPGNHDVTDAAGLRDRGRRDGVRNYLRAVAQLIPPDGAARRLAGFPTYAFGYGNTFFLALDSNIGDDRTQLDWARVQLAGLDRARYPHVVAFFHHPVFSSGPHGGGPIEQGTASMRQRWMPLFRKHHVRLLLTGHDHVYEHWVERYRGKEGDEQRIDQLVTAGGGAPLYWFEREPDLQRYLAEARTDSVRVEHLVRPGPRPEDNAYHFVIVHVDGDSMWAEVRTVGPRSKFVPTADTKIPLGDAKR